MTGASVRRRGLDPTSPREASRLEHDHCGRVLEPS